jgi:hypothetical protein
MIALFMVGKRYILSTQLYLDYLKTHLENIEKAFRLVESKCKDLQVFYDDYLYQDLVREVRKHDVSKFSGEEFTQYREIFYPFDGGKKEVPESVWEEGGFGFEAFEHHLRHNDHHWQTWTKRTYRTPNIWMVHCTHMVIDWIAMSLAKGDTAKSFYESNKNTIKLPPHGVKFIYEIFDRVYPESKEVI